MIDTKIEKVTDHFMKNRVIEEDLALLNALGLKEEEICLRDDDIELVINCFDKQYYSSNFKVKDTFYCPFAGINEFGSGCLEIIFQCFLLKISMKPQN